MDLMADPSVGGQRFRWLRLVNNRICASLAIDVGQRLTGDDVVRVLERVPSKRGKPQTIRAHNGPQFISRSLDMQRSLSVNPPSHSTLSQNYRQEGSCLVA
jgi:putative transposase